MQAIRHYAREKLDAFKGMVNAVGLKLLIFIMIAQHGIKGFLYGGGAGGVVGIPILFLLQSYTGTAQLKATQIQIYKTVALTPWALKSLFGMLTDTVYVGGYNKIPYLYLSTIGAVLSSIVIASAWPLEPRILTCLLFLMFLGCALPDLLTEAKYSERIALNPQYGPTIINFVWSGIFIGQILSTILVGVLLDYIEPHWIYYIPILPLTLVLYPIYHNWMGDRMHVNRHESDDDKVEATASDNAEASASTTRKHSPPRLEYIDNCFQHYGWFYNYSEESDSDSDIKPVYTSSGVQVAQPEVAEAVVATTTAVDDIVLTPIIGVNVHKVKREWRSFLLALMIASVSITTSTLGIIQVPTIYLCIVSIAGTLGMIVAFNLLVDSTTARIQTFVMVQNMFTISISSAEFFFYTDTAEQYPEGPHFSKKFYVTVMGVVGSLCFVAGAVSYQLIMQHWKYRNVFWFNNLIYILVGLLNVVLYKRWNLAIGIPDAVFVLGAETFQVIIGAWTSIPVTVMMSQLCPKDMEATMFAILAGSSNLGSSLAQYIGAYVLDFLHINPSGSAHESRQFENLWIASLIATLLPTVTLILIPFLIPDKYQTEDLLDSRVAGELERKLEEATPYIEGYDSIDAILSEDDDIDSDDSISNRLSDDDEVG